MMQRPPSASMLTASPTALRNPVPRSLGVRPILPDRNVSAETIEEAYVSFIFYCNPAVPLDTDTTALREAFRTPPKSGGKSFSTFTLFDLVRRFESKEIKTWAELALRLGVEPPDQDKGQSSQKIQQYAVRLKRWMHSMHVDAFFEYLLNNPHQYWTQVPTDPNPVSELGRDGVAAEDDMALRALLPQIRPRRGRKRPDDDELSKSPSQRPRLDSPMTATEFNRGGVEQLDLWSAQPDNRTSFFTEGFLRLNNGTGQPATASWTGQDISQTPLTAYPQSAITPSSRNAYWADPTEPKSAITPQKPKMSRRHGAKVVSSAWRSGAPGGTGKTRGRPPINRSSNDGSLSAYPTESPTTFKPTSAIPVAMPSTLITPTSAMNASPQTCPAPTPNMGIVNSEATPPSHDPRPPRSRLSLQVPPRVGGEVRLATPPPVVMVNGQATPANSNMGMEQPSTYLDYPTIDMFGEPAVDGADPFTGLGPSGDNNQPGVRFQNLKDRTNMDEVESLFIYEIVSADWYDGKNNRIPPCGVEEAAAIVAQVLENVMKKASTHETFLINIAALTGGTIMKTTSRLQCYRLQETAEETHYLCRWELRLGDIRGQFSMRETLRHDRWKKPETDDDSITLGADDGTGSTDESARHWQQKFRDVLDVLKKKDQELADIRRSIMQSINVKRPEDIRRT